MAKKNADTDISADFLHQLDRFHIILKKKISSKYQGGRDTSVAGGGLMFKDYKDYVPGDDFRKIDWRVYARTDKFFIRRYDEERNLTVHVIVDASTSMDFGEPKKFRYASMIGIGFAYLAMRNNEKFEFSTFSETLDAVPARKGKSHLLSLMDYLSGVRVEGKSKFTQSLESAKSLIKSRSLVIIISDFLYDLDEIRNTLMRFKNSEVLCVQVLDQVEKDFSLEGDVVLKDSEEGTELRTFITRRVKYTYRDMLAEHNAQIKSICEQLGHHFVTVHTGQEIFDAFFDAYVAMRH